jgi:hypothetical protein
MASKQSEPLKRLFANWVAIASSQPTMTLDEWRDMVDHLQRSRQDRALSTTARRGSKTECRRCGLCRP